VASQRGAGGNMTLGSIAPPSAVSTPYPMNAPIMKTSPCAKLRSLRIP
jgi:hypothetical protein